MLGTFLGHFFTYIVGAKTRQRLLFLAMVGLFLSSFALLSLQGTMGGLQHKLMGRSKAVGGNAVVVMTPLPEERASGMLAFLKERGILAVPEFEIEILAKHGHYLMPVVLHGIPKDYPEDAYPMFLRGIDWQRATLPSDLLVRLGARPGDAIQFISPSHSDASFDEVPRQVSATVGSVIITDVPEIDIAHAWVRLSSVQNLAKKRAINRVRLYGEGEDWEELTKELVVRFPELDPRPRTWEQENGALVWALGLESAVMLFLFAAMSLLVSLCISSGLMIFFDKVKLDFASFWILGAGPKGLQKSTASLLGLVCLVPILLGIGAGILFLLGLDRYGTEIMPAVFVDRKIPVHITAQGLFLSFIIPAAIAATLSWWALRTFKREARLVDHLRGL